MDILTTSPLVVLLVVVVVLTIAAFRSKALFKLALTFLLKKRRLTVLAVFGLIVASSIITGSLAVGDSMESSMIEDVYANLGGVDEVVHSNRLFNQSIFAALSSNSTLAGVTDAMAPLLMLKVAVNNKTTGRTESSVNLIGYEWRLLQFGVFSSYDGGVYAGPPPHNKTVINQKLAERLAVGSGSNVTVAARNPGFSIESIFSELGSQFSFEWQVDAIVTDTGLGRFSLDSSCRVS